MYLVQWFPTFFKLLNVIANKKICGTHSINLVSPKMVRKVIYWKNRVIYFIQCIFHHFPLLFPKFLSFHQSNIKHIPIKLCYIELNKWQSEDTNLGECADWEWVYYSSCTSYSLLLIFFAKIRHLALSIYVCKHQQYLISAVCGKQLLIDLTKCRA